MRAYQLAWIKRRRAEWIEEHGPCARCGSREDMEVDHVDRATKLLPPAKVWSLTKVKRDVELAKCQVLCGPCHRAKTISELRRIPPHGTKARYSRKDEHKCWCPRMHSGGDHV